MSQLKLQNENSFPGVWIYAFVFIIPGFSLLLALKSNATLFWVLGLWTIIFISFILLFIRPKPLEVLFFLLPLIFPALPALTAVQPIIITLVWVFVLFVIWYIQQCVYGWRTESIRPGFALILVGYTILLILSILSSSVSSVSLTNLSQCVAVIVVYWLLIQALRNQNLGRLLIAIIVGSIFGALIYFIALNRVVSQFSIGGILMNIVRPSLLNYNANLWAMCPLIGLPLLLAMLLYGRPKNRLWIWKLPAVIFLFGISILNMSRSALVAIGAGFVFVILVHPRRKRFFIYGGSACVIILAFFLPALLPYLDPVFRLEAGLSGREELWPLGQELIEDNPMFGLGPGMYSERIFYLASFMKNSIIKIIHRTSLHNVFLQIGVDIGIMGILLVLWIYLLFAVRSRRLLNRTKNTRDFPVLVAICALMVAGFVRGMFEVDFIILHGYLTDNLILLTLLAIQDQLSARYLNKKP